MDIKVLRAYKLQLNMLGYIVSDGECKGVELYRAGLRSGKTESQPLNSASRVFQYIDSYLFSLVTVKILKPVQHIKP